MGEAEDKAEKLAAAKKKYEALKKQKAKKGGAKKKEEAGKPEDSAAANEAGEEAKDAAAAAAAADTEEAAEPEAEKGEAPGEEDDKVESPTKRSGRTPSISVQSKIRSESFRNNPMSPGAGDMYSKLEELESENKKLAKEREDAEAKWRKLESELQDLREADGEKVWDPAKDASADEQSKELDKLREEIASLQRQNTQLAAKRKASPSISIPNTSNDDLNAQLNSKSETISSLELEISSLQSKLAAAQTKSDQQASAISNLELEVQKVKHEAESASQELSDLKANLEKASESSVADGAARSSAETRVAQLEAELGTAKRAAEEASKRAESQARKVETLTNLHRESDARNQARLAEHAKAERDAREMRARVAALGNENARLRDEALRRKKLEADGDAAGLEELEDEERQRLSTRVRELEEELFELRRGVWREKRMAMQPGMDADADPYDGVAPAAFDDVDLSASPTAAKKPQHSSFSDVLSSGLAAFRGEERKPDGRNRGQSVGLMSEDDFGFDEDAFRRAQEDEARDRLERVKEVKRNLVNWKGWRADLVDLRGGWGGVFEA